MNIEHLHLDTRTQNMLNAAGLNTTENVQAYCMERPLMTIRGFGDISAIDYLSALSRRESIQWATAAAATIKMEIACDPAPGALRATGWESIAGPYEPREYWMLLSAMGRLRGLQFKLVKRDDGIEIWRHKGELKTVEEEA